VCGTANPSLVSNWVLAFLERSATGLSVVVRSYEYYTKRDRHDNILASIRLCFRARPNGPSVNEREQCQVIVLDVPQPMPDRPSLIHHSLEHRTWSNASAKASTTALPRAGEGCSPAWSNAPISTTRPPSPLFLASGLTSDRVPSHTSSENRQCTTMLVTPRWIQHRDVRPAMRRCRDVRVSTSLVSSSGCLVSREAGLWIAPWNDCNLRHHG
jgi:hypothetical protein